MAEKIEIEIEQRISYRTVIDIEDYCSSNKLSEKIELFNSFKDDDPSEIIKELNLVPESVESKTTSIKIIEE